MNPTGQLQNFVNKFFDNLSSRKHSLELLRKFQRMFHTVRLNPDLLGSESSLIFQNRGLEQRIKPNKFTKSNTNCIIA